MEKKIKIVLLSQYWSEEMADMAGRKHYFRELAPWIQETINLFKNKDDVEFHVVAANYPSNKNVYAFKNNIHFHFYHYAPSLMSAVFEPLIKRVYHHAEPWKLAERLSNVLTGYCVAARNVVNLVKKINPDLIHLYGSESPDFSKGAWKLLGQYPTLLTVQGYAYKLKENSNLFERVFHWYMAHYEDKINKNVEYRTVLRPIPIEKIIIPNKHFFEKCKNVYVVQSITKIPKINAINIEKKYDIVFYARIVKNKGIEDLIEAVSLLNNKGRALKAVVMGRGNETYVEELKGLIKVKGIEKLIDFVGYVDDHEEVYKIAAQAQLLVLPTYRDGINNTVREAMFMRLPIVATNIVGLSGVNKHRHCAHLLEPGNIDELAEGMCKVLDDDVYRNELIENAYKEACEVFSPEVVYGQTIQAYRDLMKYLKIKE